MYIVVQNSFPSSRWAIFLGGRQFFEIGLGCRKQLKTIKGYAQPMQDSDLNNNG